MEFPFTKMQGLGNDVIVLDAPTREGLPITARQWRQLADRRMGIGFDQAMVLEPPRSAGTDAYYRIFNADGSEVEQCGNGVRCLAELMRRRGVARDGVIHLESLAGPIECRLGVLGTVAVNMGEPQFTPESVHFDAEGQPGPIYSVSLPEQQVEFVIASMGNPHAVIDMSDVAVAPVADLGLAIERHPRFARRVNVGFRHIVDRGHLRLRVFERGVGETPACGTGACAAAATGIRAGRLDSKVIVELTGGKLQVRWDGPGTHLWAEGPAAISFSGRFELSNQ